MVTGINTDINQKTGQRSKKSEQEVDLRDWQADGINMQESNDGSCANQRATMEAYGE